MTIKPKMIDFYMAVAKQAAQLSVAKRLQVGAVVIKDDNIISYSWNGTPPGWDNNCEDVLPDGSLVTKKCVVHAEMNSIIKVAKSNESCKDAVLVVTHSPCDNCAKLLITAGIKEVYYGENYRDTLGIDMLSQAGIKVTKV